MLLVPGLHHDTIPRRTRLVMLLGEHTIFIVIGVRLVVAHALFAGCGYGSVRFGALFNNSF